MMNKMSAKFLGLPLGRMVWVILIGALVGLGLFWRLWWSSPTPAATTNTSLTSPAVRTANVQGRIVTLATDLSTQYKLSSEIKGEVRPTPTLAPVLPLGEATPIASTPLATSPTVVPPTVAVAPPPTAVPSTTDGVTFVDHYVQLGETLFGLQSKYNTTMELMGKHGLTVASMIAGTTIKLPVYGGVIPPGTVQNVSCKSGRSHTVTQGQNLFRIGLQYSTTYETLAALNSIIDPHWISIGQIVCLP